MKVSMELPKAEMNTTAGVKLQARLKRFWWVYFAISVLSMGLAVANYVVPWALSYYDDSPKGIVDRITSITGTTEAERLRDKVAEAHPKELKDTWDRYMESFKEYAEDGKSYLETDVTAFGPEGSTDLKWFTDNFEKEGLKWELREQTEWGRRIRISW